MNNHQRVGAISNAHVGREFEAAAQDYFERVGGRRLTPSFRIDIGVASTRKIHRFDFGCLEERLLVECKSHTWTAAGSMPSAKVTVWNEAMYYFHLAPKEYRKFLFVLESRHPKQRETLAEYYSRIYAHLIPADVAIFEYNPSTLTGRCVKTVLLAPAELELV